MNDRYVPAVHGIRFAICGAWSCRTPKRQAKFLPDCKPFRQNEGPL